MVFPYFSRCFVGSNPVCAHLAPRRAAARCHMKMETPTTPTARPAIVTGRQLCSAGMVKEANAASNHSTAPATITGRGSNSAAGNSGGSVPVW